MPAPRASPAGSVAPGSTLSLARKQAVDDLRLVCWRGAGKGREEEGRRGERTDREGGRRRKRARGLVASAVRLACGFAGQRLRTRACSAYAEHIGKSISECHAGQPDAGTDPRFMATSPKKEFTLYLPYTNGGSSGTLAACDGRWEARPWPDTPDSDTTERVGDIVPESERVADRSVSDTIDMPVLPPP